MSTNYAMCTPMTGKQLEVLRVIANKENGGRAQDIDRIISRLSYKTTKQSFQFVIRALIKRELIEKLDCKTARGKKRRFLKITSLGLNKLENEPKRAEDIPDPKTTGVGERERTDRLIQELEEQFKGLL